MFLTVALGVVLLGVLSACDRGDVASIERQYDGIVANLPVGTTATEITSYLESNGIARRPVEPAEAWAVNLTILDRDEPIPDDTPLIRAVVFGESGVNGPKWEVYFLLDNSHRLEKIVHVEFGATTI